MTVLLVLTLVWTTVLVLALLYFLVPTALYLSRTRRRLAEVADDLERAGRLCAPVDDKLVTVHARAGAVIGALARVRAALAAVLTALRAPIS
ncbi:MAG: hypothetical protein ABIP94_11975 [Planctomycetota bacterium]